MRPVQEELVDELGSSPPTRRPAVRPVFRGPAPRSNATGICAARRHLAGPAPLHRRSLRRARRRIPCVAPKPFGPKARLAVGSALFGLVRAEDRIRLPAVHDRQTARTAGPGCPLAPGAGAPLAEVAERELVVICAPAPMWDSGLPSQSVKVDVVAEQSDGKRSVVSHFNKAHWDGWLGRWPPDDPNPMTPPEWRGSPGAPGCASSATKPV